jgi:hypothetical protein
VTTLTTDQGLILPVASDADNVPTSFTSYNTGVESRLAKRYLSAADRTTRNPTPTEGELSYLVSTGEYELYDGSAWGHPFPTLSRGAMATPTTTGSDGTATSGTTETRDAVLGNFAFTSAGTTRRYRVTWTGQLGVSVANDLFVVNLRDGGASTPTAASTLIARGQKRFTQSGGTGEETMVVTGTFTASAGTRTISAFTVRSSGTGTATPKNTRELYVEDIGLA